MTIEIWKFEAIQRTHENGFGIIAHGIIVLTILCIIICAYMCTLCIYLYTCVYIYKIYMTLCRFIVFISSRYITGFVHLIFFIPH